ncbi:DUF6624 domain-containing protein [Streptomyces sp. NPDC005551]|uniref:DUF6624 domain-containing protein n=1 Tax=unclassified Streptomyces TaxID=2593676 RepID=UPI0033CE4547
MKRSEQVAGEEADGVRRMPRPDGRADGVPVFLPGQRAGAAPMRLPNDSAGDAPGRPVRDGVRHGGTALTADGCPAGDAAPSRDPGTGPADGSPLDGGAAGTRMLPGVATLLAGELIRRAEEDTRLTRRAQTDLAPGNRRALVACRRANADALRTIVSRHGWPTADQVGAAASTAAVMILLHTPDLDFQLLCRDLIAQAAADGRCPEAQHAYIADHCAVELGEPQFYGTRVNPLTLRPYAIRQPHTIDERRRDVGLGPLDEQMRALRHHG